MEDRAYTERARRIFLTPRVLEKEPDFRETYGCSPTEHALD